MTTFRFNYWQLVWSNVRTRPVRTALCVAAVAIQVVLILLVVGMIDGVVSEWGQRVEGVGADLLVRPPNSSIFFSLSSALMPQALDPKIDHVPGVRAVSPVEVLVQASTFDVVYGIDYPTFNSLSEGFRFLAGGPFRGPNDAIVDNIKAETHHLHVGEHITLLNHDFTVCGIVESGKGARLFIPLTTAQEISGAADKVSMFYVRSDGDTAGTDARLEKLLPDARIFSMKEYLTLMNSSNLPQLRPFVRSMVGLGVAISFLVVFLATYTIVLERTHEIGILKALGASKPQVVSLILKETLLLAALGTLAGLGATGATWIVLHREVPSLTILISGRWVAGAILLALAAAMAGASFPALRAARFDPVDALAYE